MVEMRGHTKQVVTIAIDPSGSRMLSGSGDYLLKFWDFATMDAGYRSFREVEPSEGNPVISIDWNSTGSEFIVSTGNLQPRLYDKDGFLQAEYKKGDPYLLDMNNTKGHTSAVNQVLWDPTNPDRFLSGSADSTIRIWDKNNTNKQLTVIRAKNKTATRVQINAIAVDKSGKGLVAAGCFDGSLQIWPIKGPYHRPSISNQNAHQDGAEYSSLAFSSDGNLLISRNCDHTLKVWDLRKFSSPLRTHENLYNTSPSTQCIFSPDDAVILTGTSISKENPYGSLCFIDKSTLNIVHETQVSNSSVIGLSWHSKLNQIFTGNGDGVIRAFYSPNLSFRGVLMGRSRDPKNKKFQGYTNEIAIHNPHSLPLFKPEPSHLRQKVKARKDPIKSKKPDMPVSGPGKGGKVGSCLTQHLVRNMIIHEKRIEDPREALLRHAKDAEENPIFFGKAYEQTQPKAIFYEEEEEDDDE